VKGIVMKQEKKIISWIKLFILISIFGFGSQLFAQGFIIPRPHPRFIHPMPQLTEHEVDVEITDRVAEVTVEQVFYNGSGRQMEGTYYFPLPKGASISDFKMYADGKVLSGELLEKEKARKIYEDIVRRNIDPALLEYVDHNLFSASIFPIPAKKERKIVLKYSSMLEQDGDLVKFSYPLRGEIGAGRTGPHPPILRGRHEKENRKDYLGNDKVEQTVNLNIESKVAIKNIYSPSHDVDISRRGDFRAKVSYEGVRKETEENFVLYYSYSESDFGMSLLSFHPRKKEYGYFMMLISPKVAFKKSEIIKKDIIFILDTSGSMKGEKIKQAKDGLEYCLKSLNANDRFNLISFSTESKFFKDNLVDASEYKNDALDYINDLEAKGGTNISEALMDALKMERKKGRPLSIVFMTDGLPTSGERDVGNIIKNVSRKNKEKIKIFTFGVGYDVNTYLLDKIADESQAASDYIEPEEDIEEKISSFYDKVSHPVLTDLNIDFGNIKVDDVFPKRLPDLFKGSQITIMGRYQKDKNSEITLTGKVSTKRKQFEYDAEFTASKNNDFLAHLWATRKIGFLMDEIRLHGENDELKEEVIRLSKKYGVMSPYTSFLVQEEEEMADKDRFHLGQGVPLSTMDASINAPMAVPSKRAGAGEAKKVGGVYQVKMSKQTRTMKEAETISADQKIKRAGKRSFYKKGEFWIDTEYNEEKTINIKYGSQAYTELILTYPEIAKIVAMGDKIIFKFKDRFVKISEKGKEKMSKKELRSLFE
jgi:Ca-activated chloride channel homolog